MSILTVVKNSTSIPLPSDELKQLTVNVYDLDSDEGAGRNQLGEQFRDRVAVKRKVNCEWGYLSAIDMATILNATEDEFFDLIYPDPKTGAGRRMTCYVGDRSTPIYVVNGGNVTEGSQLNGMWSGLSMNFIEK